MLKKNKIIFDDKIVEEVWGKALPDDKHLTFRKDHYGTLIRFVSYGKLSIYGWIIKHIIPPAKGGTNTIDNLYPVHWINSKRKKMFRFNNLTEKL